MIHSATVRIVDLCARNRWTIVIAGMLLMLGAAAFDGARFSMFARGETVGDAVSVSFVDGEADSFPYRK